MSDVTLDPYLFFQGNCREAMEFYKSIFGGELTIQTYGDVNAASGEKDKDNIMHARLEGGDVKLMGSDTTQASDKMAKVSLSLGGSDEPKLRQIFEDLSVSADVRSPLKKEFWGDTFGSLTDRYGVDWMMNITES